MNSGPNPQGKGLVSVLDNLENSRPILSVPPKSIHQISSELFTSLFVLESKFSFKPVIGKRYYLYRKGGQYRLSLIAPKEWDSSIYGVYIGKCLLHEDITWTLELSEQAASDKEFQNDIAVRQLEFEAMLKNAEKVTSVLPVFNEKLPYYQRICASALAYSLNISIYKSGFEELSYHEAKALLLEK
ncbi:MAG: DUF2452 domain-containing protein [SAR324 cluster bacterium]|nr:DUF2452 domain-containing protein [SAR324 cluster bacterium]